MSADRLGWLEFRKTCDKHRTISGTPNLCVTVDNRGNILAFHGDCVVDNCSAKWNKIPKRSKHDEVLDESG